MTQKIKSIRFNKLEYTEQDRMIIIVETDEGNITHSLALSHLVKAIELFQKEGVTYEFLVKRK